MGQKGRQIIPKPTCLRRDCFANNQDKCQCLQDNNFGDRACPFFKTKDEMKGYNYSTNFSVNYDNDKEKAMIRLSDDWVILVDQFEYILSKDLHKKSLINGKLQDTYKQYGHFSTLKSALKGYRDILIKSKLQDDVFTVAQAIGEIKMIDNDLKKVLEKALEGGANEIDQC